jgi:hypothetical protein
MARNILQDVANTLPRMVMSERMPSSDLEALAERPDGTLSIDLLRREARDSSGALVPLQIVKLLADWLEQRLGAHRLDAGTLSGAHLTLTLRTDAVPTVRATAILFDWSCSCEVAPGDGETRSGGARGRGTIETASSAKAALDPAGRC